MTLRTRLALGLLAIALILMLPLAVALRSLQRLHDSAIELRDREFAASLLLGRMRTGADDLRRAEDALLFVHDPASNERMGRELQKLAAQAGSLDRFALDSAARLVRSELHELSSLAPREYDLAVAGSAAAESLSTQRVRPAIGRVVDVVNDAERSLRDRTQQRVARAAAETKRSTETAAVSLAGALLIALLVALWLMSSISGPVRDLQAGMAAVSEGDLSYQLGIEPTRQDEFGRLARSYKTMASQLGELDKLKAEFVSVASHELKTPINVIIGYLQLFDEGVYGELSPKQRDICKTLETQTKTLARLVHQLLDVSRFEAGGGKLELRRVDLPAFLHELEGFFHGLALQRNIEFRISESQDLPAEVTWDPDRMNEVLGNLLSNAFKFTARGGRVELLVRAAAGNVHMEVRDTGAGIPPEQLSKVFEKFYQADNQASASTKGTGLGLAIAKEILEAHGGSITVRSARGTGTTFTVVLPVSVTAEHARTRISGGAAA